ncbi:MAG TPA: hypothetical protein VH306_00610 [Gaiellaceae bacterium]|jgi:hypothetical protein
MRRLARLLALVGAAAAGLAILRRARGEARERVEVSFDDGSSVSFDGSSAEAERLMPLARRVLASARG